MFLWLFCCGGIVACEFCCCCCCCYCFCVEHTFSFFIFLIKGRGVIRGSADVELTSECV